jgi:hypothetical protein
MAMPEFSDFPHSTPIVPLAARDVGRVQSKAMMSQIVGMDVREFLGLNEGKWVSQRSSHPADFQPTGNGKAEVTIVALAADDAAVADLCRQYRIDPQAATGGMKISWQGMMAWDKDTVNQNGSTAIVLVPDGDDANCGKLLQAAGTGKSPIVGRYSLEADEAMTFTIDDGKVQNEERIWFASPNLRMRTNVYRDEKGMGHSSFCSEIRSMKSS